MLPRAEEVPIDARKVSGYLLSRTHPVGRFKAHVFAAAGFDDTQAEAFIVEIRRIAVSGEVAEVEDTESGRTLFLAT